MGKKEKIGPLALWSLVAGGMVGGGIYTALGVVVALAGQWAWLSLLLAGLVAIPSAVSYCRLSNHFEESGGAFKFLERMRREGMAGSLAWILLLGYVLTIALYAFAFGHYVAFALHLGAVGTRVLALGILLGLTVLNLAGVAKMKQLELSTVVLNLLVLVGLAAWGLADFQPPALVSGIEPQPVWAALVGAASIFVSYEGFQLVTYEYDKIEQPRKYLLPVVVAGVVFVVLVYIAVALGATSLAGALTVIEKKQVALSLAAYRAAGIPGLALLTLAAALATTAAINSTLFSSAQLALSIAKDGELPRWFERTNSSGAPVVAVTVLGTAAALLAVIGSLSALVETASLAFLATFAVVNALSLQTFPDYRWVPWSGLLLGATIGLFLLLRLAISTPVTLVLFLLSAVLIFLGRPYLLKRVATDA